MYIYIGISHYASATLNEGCLHSCCLRCQPCKGDKGVSHLGMYNVAIDDILVQPKCCQHNDNAWCHGHYWSLMIDHVMMQGLALQYWDLDNYRAVDHLKDSTATLYNFLHTALEPLYWTGRMLFRVVWLPILCSQCNPCTVREWIRLWICKPLSQAPSRL